MDHGRRYNAAALVHCAYVVLTSRVQLQKWMLKRAEWKDCYLSFPANVPVSCFRTRYTPPRLLLVFFSFVFLSLSVCRLSWLWPNKHCVKTGVSVRYSDDVRRMLAFSVFALALHGCFRSLWQSGGSSILTFVYTTRRAATLSRGSAAPKVRRVPGKITIDLPGRASWLKFPFGPRNALTSSGIEMGLEQGSRHGHIAFVVTDGFCRRFGCLILHQVHIRG